MLNGFVCKVFGKKSVTLRDLIDLVCSVVLVVGVPMWTIGYYLKYGCPLDDDLTFIPICWLLGVVITCLIGISLIFAIYELSSEIEIANCPLNKK